jgi:hypothetical protein
MVVTSNPIMITSARQRRLNLYEIIHRRSSFEYPGGASSFTSPNSPADCIWSSSSRIRTLISRNSAITSGPADGLSASNSRRLAKAGGPMLSMSNRFSRALRNSFCRSPRDVFARGYAAGKIAEGPSEDGLGNTVIESLYAPRLRRRRRQRKNNTAASERIAQTAMTLPTIAPGCTVFLKKQEALSKYSSTAEEFLPLSG